MHKIDPLKYFEAYSERVMYSHFSVASLINPGTLSSDGWCNPISPTSWECIVRVCPLTLVL